MRHRVRAPRPVRDAALTARPRPRGPAIFARDAYNVGVGMPFAQHPVDRSVRAGFPHTAPALGRDDQTLIRVTVADTRRRQPVRDQAMHPTPRQVMRLAAAAQSTVPQAGDLETECDDARAVVGHAEVAGVSTDHCAQVSALPAALPSAPQMVAGPPGSRTSGFRVCAGSLTVRGPCLPRQGGTHGAAFGKSPLPLHR